MLVLPFEVQHWQDSDQVRRIAKGTRGGEERTFKGRRSEAALKGFEQVDHQCDWSDWESVDCWEWGYLV